MKRKRGRPRLDEEDETVPIALKVPSRQYDRLFLLAQRARVSVPEIVRRFVREHDRKENLS